MRFAIEGGLVAFLILAAGLTLRVLPLVLSDAAYPVHSAGLYAEFAKEIAEGSFTLPARISHYTSGGIPFAYPPLPFYLLAVLTSAGMPLYFAINALPVALACVSLLVFGRTASLVARSRLECLAALGLFALLPRCWEEFIRPDGLAEGHGLAALAYFFGALLRRDAAQRRFYEPGFAFAICVVSSPGSAMAGSLAYLVWLFALMVGSRERALPVRWLDAFGVGVFAIVLTAPYWSTVVLHHGLTIFLEVIGGQSRDSSLTAFSTKLGYFAEVTVGPGLAIVASIVILGILASLRAGVAALLVGMLLVCLVVPREEWVVVIPVALLFGRGVATVNDLSASQPTMSKWVVHAVWLGWGTLSMASAVINATRAATHLQAPKQQWSECEEAARWLEANTPRDARVVVAGDSHSAIEWFPFLSQRTVLNSWVGTEWEPEERALVERFNSYLRIHGLGEAGRLVALGFGEGPVWFVAFGPSDDLIQRDVRIVDFRWSDLSSLPPPVFSDGSARIFALDARL